MTEDANASNSTEITQPDTTQSKSDAPPASWKELLPRLTNFLHEVFVEKLPPLPEHVKETIVKIIPWAILITTILLVIPMVTLLMGVAALSLVFLAFWNIFIIGLTIVSVVLRIRAIPKLFSRSFVGWKLCYYALLLDVLTSVFQFSFMSLIFNVISLYIMFQVRAKYTN